MEIAPQTEVERANPGMYTFVGVCVATLAEVAALGAWIYWVTIAGPILAQGRVRDYGQVAPFFVGSLVGY